MKLRRSRFAVVLTGDRLVAAWLRKDRTETFVVDAEQPAEALRAEFDARRIDTKAVAIGLSRAAVSVKPIELPTVGGEMRDMVRFELDRHLPFPADDAPFDFVPLPSANAGGATAAPAQVLVLAADRRVVDSALRIVQEANLRPRSLTVAAHDLAWLVRPTQPQQHVVWLHRAGDASDLLFLLGRRLVLSRRVNTTDDGVVVDEIRRSFAVARWRSCDAVWVSGDIAPETLTGGPLTDLGAPVTEPPFSPGVSRRLAGLGPEGRGAAMLAIGVAAARRGRPLDLIPPGLRPRRVTRGQGVTLAVLAATIVLSIAALLVPGYVEQRRLNAVNTSISRLDGEVRGVERSLRDLDRKKKLAATIESLPASGIRALPVLRELTELVPNDAWLTTLSFEAKGVEMTGQAAAASSLIPALENSARFQRVEFASPVTRGRDKEQFRIQAAWETPPGRIVDPALATTEPATPAPVSTTAPALPAAPPAGLATPPPPVRGAAPPATVSPAPSAPPAPRASEPRRPATAPARQGEVSR
jgi:Tfp pilus assembly protein PilN